MQKYTVAATHAHVTVTAKTRNSTAEKNLLRIVSFIISQRLTASDAYAAHKRTVHTVYDVLSAVSANTAAVSAAHTAVSTPDAAI